MSEKPSSEARRQIYEEYKDEFYEEVMNAPEVADILTAGRNSAVYEGLIRGIIHVQSEYGTVKLKYPQAFTELQMSQLEGSLGGRQMVLSVVEEIIQAKGLSSEDAEKFRNKVESITDLVSFDTQE